MEKKSSDLLNTIIQWGLFLFVNALFVYKYCPRIGLNPIVSVILYSSFVIGGAILYKQLIAPNIDKHGAHIISLALIIGVIAIITIAIIYIPPLSIQVDRWSATSYFLDALFHGDYPYGVFTHRGAGKFPSPFPFWHYLNIPFWLIGDVGWIQAFCILIFLRAALYYFRSWNNLLTILLLLCISPAYWWEIATRSDGLSNILLVLTCILVIQRKPITMQDRWWLLAIITGCFAATRLSAIIPFALYQFRSWLEVNWKKKVGFIGITLFIVIIAFLPYILWDTTNWIFFERNPFLTQGRQGSIWLLLLMVALAIVIAYKKQTFYYYASTTSVYMLFFMFFSQLNDLLKYSNSFSFIDNRCDISYFTLSLPFAIIALTLNRHTTP